MDVEKLSAEVRNLQGRLAQMAKRVDHLYRSIEQVDKGTQMLLQHKYRELAERGVVLSFDEVGFRNYSQYEEDGIIHYLLCLLGNSQRKTVEICAGKGWESMSANLILNHGWYSLLVDGNPDLVKAGVEFFAQHPSTMFAGPKFLNCWVKRETVNEMLRDAGFSGEVDLLSLDMDGVDYWIWDALTEISPRVVVAEVMVHLGAQSISVPYSPEFRALWINLEEETSQQGDADRKGPIYNRALYGGASLPAFTKLANRKGYRLIGANRIGCNAFFMRNDVGQEYFPEKHWEECVNPNFDPKARQRILDALLEYEWVEV